MNDYIVLAQRKEQEPEAWRFGDLNKAKGWEKKQQMLGKETALYARQEASHDAT